MQEQDQTPDLDAGKEPSAMRLSLSTAAVMLLFTLVFTGLMAGTYEATRDDISRSAAEAQLRLINEILPSGSYDNALLEDVRELGPTPELGLAKGGKIWRARKAGQPVALVMESVAPDGYAGQIRLVIAVMADGRIGGVRVTEHRETPGLGDYIDPKKDKNKQAPWIDQFRGQPQSDFDPARWTVSKDGGQFAYRAGATISARAVSLAVGRSLNFARQQGAALYE